MYRRHEIGSLNRTCGRCKDGPPPNWRQSYAIYQPAYLHGGLSLRLEPAWRPNETPQEQRRQTTTAAARAERAGYWSIANLAAQEHNACTCLLSIPACSMMGMISLRTW